MKKEEIQGLTSKEVQELQTRYGKNIIIEEKKETFVQKIFEVIKEPMFVLLLSASIIYFVLGEPRDGIIMLIFVIGIISIEVMQEWKTDKTLSALKDLSNPKSKVLRDGVEQEINSEDLVVNDIMIISEGDKIPADGFVLESTGLCVDESSLSGEPIGVWKFRYDESVEHKDYWRTDYCYAGTFVVQGQGYIKVDKIGKESEFGKIGANVLNAPSNSTLLQKQTQRLVKTCAIIAGVFFLLVVAITYFNLSDHVFRDRIIESILSGITLAMAMIPEEFPVILTVFLSMGAWRLAKNKALVRRLPAVETLGAVSVLCVDKTGTITMNQMNVQNTWSIDYKNILLQLGRACPQNPYDPMEQAMLFYCEQNGIRKEDIFSYPSCKEYAFTNEYKMMANAYQEEQEVVVYIKGSLESVIHLCALSNDMENIIMNKASEFSLDGQRVIALAKARYSSIEALPESICELSATFIGLTGLIDPPRKNIQESIKRCNNAGVRVVMITGDNGVTASTIAEKVGILHSERIITGEELEKMSEEEVKDAVKEISIFSRVIPEHKMRIVKAFKDNGEVVAMSGDGVNDAPALKYADIGIAMGKRGSQVSREAADLILLDDNFSTIVNTISDGRRIYDNIRKAVGYVFTIHIPIVFAALLAPLLKVSPADLFLLPLHVVLLELIIDPTCSIVLERQPAEEDIMDRPPRKTNENILTISTLIKSLIQGFVIFITSFLTYYLVLESSKDAALARTMGLLVIMFANVFLVQVNSSSTRFAYQNIILLRKDKIMWAVNIGTIAGVLLITYSPLNRFLKLASLSPTQFLSVIGLAAASVLWYDLIKVFRKVKAPKNT